MQHAFAHFLIRSSEHLLPCPRLMPLLTQALGEGPLVGFLIEWSLALGGLS